MDHPFNPHDPHASPAEEPLDLGPFRPFEISDHTPSVVDAAVARGPQPIAMKTPDLLARQTSDAEEPGWAARMFQRKSKIATTEEEKPSKKGVSRRGFLRNVRDTALVTGAAAATWKGYDTLWGDSNTPMALLKMDPDLKQLGLVHRRADMSILKFADREGTDALTLTNDNLESLLLSPELALKLKQDEATFFRDSDDKNNTDKQVVRLHGTARNIYIPYHLFTGAVSFSVYQRMEPEKIPLKGKRLIKPGEYIASIKGEDVKIVPYDDKPLKQGERLRKTQDGAVDRLIPLGTHELKRGERIEDLGGEYVKIVYHPKLVIGINGPHAAKDMPITTDIANATETVKNAIGDTATGWLGKITSAWDDFKDWSGIGGDGVDTMAAESARHNAAILERERSRPHPQDSADFHIEMDYPADGKLPNLHFYNGRTLEEPNYHILGEELAEGMAKDPALGMRIITNKGIVYNDANNHIGAHQNVEYYDERLHKRAEASKLHTDSRIEEGILTEMGTGLKNFTIIDNKLNSYEEAALALASAQIQRSENNRWSLKERFANRVMDKPDTDIGR